MAYQYPQGGHYPPQRQYQQPYLAPAQQSPQQQQQYQPNTGAPFPQHTNPALYPQAVLPGYPTYPPQPQQPYPVSRPVNLAPSYPPPTGQVPPGQGGAALQYGGSPAAQQYYSVPNQPTLHPSPRPQIVIPPPPRSQSQPQPIAPAHTPRSYPQVQIQSRPASQQQQRSVSETSQPVPKVKQRPKKEPSLQRMRSKSPVKKQEPHIHPGHAKKSVDYQVLLLALADEYLDAAHSRGTTLALSRHEAEIDEYYKLIATGLGCLEAVLKNWRLQPRTEALVRLRYARVLFEEADNDLEAETALSKGVDLCERNRMLDLKYSMQQLLARIFYKSNPKAAMKSVDGIIRDIEVYRHATWEYAFRLLRVTMSLSASPPHQDVVAASQNLHAISNLAKNNGDKAVFVVSSILEALAHIQQSSSADSIEQAQRALAAARSHQLDDSVQDIPQINIMIQILDTCCSLLEYDVNQAAQKLQSMQKTMDQNLNDPKWQENGTFSIPLSSQSSAGPAIGDGGIVGADNGKVVLTFSWLSEHDLYTLCYFLSSVTLTAKNSQDGRKAEKFLKEGLRMIRSSFKSPQGIPESLVSATSRLQWRRALHCNMLLQLIFLSCARTDWQLASKTLDELREAIIDLGESTSDTINCLMEYAAGVIAQGTGDLKSALAIFRRPILALKPSASKTARNDPQRDTAILAALNTVLILSDPSRQSRPAAFKILSDIEPFSRTSPNKYIQAAFSLVCATIQNESTIQTKRDLGNALHAATAISNSQITCIVLSFMSWRYFHNVVSEQSEKSAMAARATARKADDKLWISVTEEILAGTLEQQGKVGEARALRDTVDASLSQLPAALKKPTRPEAGGGGFPQELRMKAVEI